MDPTEVYGRFRELAAEFPDLATIDPAAAQDERVPAAGAGADGRPDEPGLHREPRRRPSRAQAVILTSRAWGHEGGNDLTAEFVDPGVPNSPLSVTFTGQRPPRQPGDRRDGRATSTAAQVIAAINASPALRASSSATYRGNAGTGIVQPRTKGNLSDFLTTATNAHVQRGPFEHFVLRIGKNRPGNSADRGFTAEGRRLPLLPAARP